MLSRTLFFLLLALPGFLSGQGEMNPKLHHLKYDLGGAVLTTFGHNYQPRGLAMAHLAYERFFPERHHTLRIGLRGLHNEGVSFLPEVGEGSASVAGSVRSPQTTLYKYQGVSVQLGYFVQLYPNWGWRRPQNGFFAGGELLVNAYSAGYYQTAYTYRSGGYGPLGWSWGTHYDTFTTFHEAQFIVTLQARACIGYQLALSDRLLLSASLSPGITVLRNQPIREPFGLVPPVHLEVGYMF
ncbi:MAG: hypothetical protein D6722_03120 [Bacteroidetes bacterium]|nr:MAG: hypothetical protein D6722_03120 [Bacteroidota bacterium]